MLDDGVGPRAVVGEDSWLARQVVEQTRLAVAIDTQARAGHLKRVRYLVHAPLSRYVT